MRLDARSIDREAGFFSLTKVGAASTRRLPLREIGPLYTPEGPVCSVRHERGWQERRSGTVTDDEEGSMDQMILGAMALVTLLWWASAARWRTAVAVRRQAKLSRPRVR